MFEYAYTASFPSTAVDKTKFYLQVLRNGTCLRKSMLLKFRNCKTYLN